MRAILRLCHRSGMGLLMSACASTGIAAWRLAAIHAPPAAEPPPPSIRPLPVVGRALVALAPAPETVATLRRLRHGAVAPGPDAEMDRWIRRFLDPRGGGASLRASLGRMRRYEPLILEALGRHGMPRELLYLPIIESEFVESAFSRAGAAGLWQFMPATARLYGLEVSTYVDERRDPVRSTDAAIRHLRDLHARFGSWHLALAAYNAGSGRVDGALRREGVRGGGNDLLYWRVRPHLPRETRSYVPLYLAAAAVARDADALGLRPPPTTPLAFSELWVPGGVALESVARAQGVSPALLRQLNPHLIRGTTPPGRRWPVRVPPAGAPPTDSTERWSE